MNLACRWEVYFVGAEAKIDMQDSGKWIQGHTYQWKFPVHIKVSLLDTTLTTSFPVG